MKYILLFSLNLFLVTSGSAQLVVSPATATQLANKLLGSGITIMNATVTGDTSMYGTFTAMSTNLGIDSGITLVTGPATEMAGPNLIAVTGVDMALAGDFYLDSLYANTSHDAVILEFDFIPSNSTFSFQYVFVSEEYPEYVCSAYNDVFAFFISGPGITGQMNIAYIPNSNINVSINTVNDGHPGNYGSSTTPGCDTSHSSFFVDNSNGLTIEADGFTRELLAIANVTSGLTYHMKIIVADMTDGVFDSGVYIEENSVQSPTSIDDKLYNLENISIIPNPISDEFFLTNALPGLKYSLQLFDVNGKNLFSATKYGCEKISIPSLSNGVYFLRIDNGKEVSVKHLFKN